MADDSEFLSRLISFGLSEKEAQLYFHLLKYGPKPPSLLAKSLKTYREDVYRTLTGLIDKGMVNPSLDSPTVYSAVELEVALDAALKKQEAELREMEMKKQELQELSRQQRFRPSDEFTTYRIIKNVKDLITFAIPLISSLERDLLWVGPELSTVVSSLYGVNEATFQLISRGGHSRGVTDISYRVIEPVQQLLDVGLDIRHLDRYSGLIFVVFDRKYGLSAINLDLETISSRYALDGSLAFLVTDDPTYVEYLVSTFELLWERAIPATERIEELLKEGPPQA